MFLINCEINLILTWSSNCVITKSASARTFAITDIKLYVPVITLSANENEKLLLELKSRIKGTINWDKYQSEITIKL